MLSSLLRTKLYIPTLRPMLVPRPRLLMRLNEGLHRKLTLLAAPAGSGKTTLVSDWLRQINQPAAWLSLDGADNDLALFWSYLIAALQFVQPNVGQVTLAGLQSIGLGNVDLVSHLEKLCITLLNDIAALPEQLVLVLDDYHLIESAEIHAGLNFCLNHLPPTLHLVLITREDPPWPLAQLRVKQQLTELRASDLHFTTEEATQFLNQTMGLELSQNSVRALEQRTEGWIAGLQMAALSMQHRPDAGAFVDAFAGDDRYVVDYLIAEVLDHQPAHVLSFLQQTAILKHFTTPLCEAVTGQANVDQILRYLEETNLFLVALDNRREWYRYHHLFGDLLYHRLKKNSPDQLAQFHRLASYWYHEQGFVDEAVDHALAGQDYPYATDLIEAVGLQMIGQAKLSPLQGWILSLPEALITERPYLAVLLAWISVLTRQPDQAEQYLALAEPGAQTLADDVDHKGEIICQIALLWGYITRLRADLPASIAHIKRAIQFLPADNAFLQCTAYLNLGGSYWGQGNFAAVEAPWRKALTFLDAPDMIYPALVAAGYLSNAYLQQGQLKAAARLCRDIEQSLDHHHRPPPAIAYLAIEQGALFYEQNNLTAATKSLTQAIKLGENLDGIVNIGRAFLLLAWIEQIAGQVGEVARLIEQAEANRPPNIAEFDYYQVRLWLAQGNLEAARQWGQVYQQQAGQPRQWGVLSALTFAHVLLADQQVRRALDILDHCETATQTAGIRGWLIRSLALKALCHQSLPDPDQAHLVLQQALALAEPEGYCRTFIDHGRPMQQLLEQATRQGIASPYVTQLLAAFPASRSPAQPSAQPPKALPLQTLLEPLKAREMAILRLIAAGLSNREIGEQLHLSTNTIKWYTSQLYGKLGVKKRAEAIDQAHAWGLL